MVINRSRQTELLQFYRKADSLNDIVKGSSAILRNNVAFALNTPEISIVRDSIVSFIYEE